MSLVEIIVAMVIIVVVFISGFLIFSSITRRISSQSAEKTISQRATDFILFLRPKLKQTIIRNIPGNFRIDFVGTETSIKFVAPYTEGKGSDLGMYGIYLDGDKIKMSFERIDASMDSYEFPSGFSGSQILVENVKKLEFSYWDGSSWQNYWDTKNQEENAKLPEKIKVVFILYGGNLEGRRIEKGFSEEIWMGQ